ncbi:MAG TPA: hypothetical protein VMF09_10860 [Solirubrobacteraceae bacterium]|nr:hypothetical protein [Solirubrobacteraceae bacterium]
MFGALRNADSDFASGSHADCARGRLGQHQKPAPGGFAHALKRDREFPAERVDLFCRADQRQCTAAPGSDGDDRLLEDGCCRSYIPHAVDFFSDVLTEAFGAACRDFKRRAARDAVRDFFKGPGDAAMGDLNGEQQRNPGCNTGHRHQLPQRLDPQVAPVKQEQRSQISGHSPTVASV